MSQVRWKGCSDGGGLKRSKGEPGAPTGGAVAMEGDCS